MPQVCLSAMGWWDGSEVGGPGAGSEQLNYVSFGAGVWRWGSGLRVSGMGSDRGGAHRHASARTLRMI